MYDFFKVLWKLLPGTDKVNRLRRKIGLIHLKWQLLWVKIAIMQLIVSSLTFGYF